MIVLKNVHVLQKGLVWLGNFRSYNVMSSSNLLSGNVQMGLEKKTLKAVISYYSYHLLYL